MKTCLYFGVLTLMSLPCVSIAQTQDISLHYQICNNCSAQEGGDTIGGNYTYGAMQAYQSRDITSDFGARYLGYDWHKGVDYRPIQFAGPDNDLGRGTAIMAAESGSVALIRAGGGYKYIVIDGAYDLGYGHIFNARNPGGSWLQSGDFVLKAMDFPYGEYYAIINLETGIAIGQEAGTVTFNGVEYAVQTEINAANQAIAPMGGSGGSYQANDPFPVHLHVYRFRDINTTPIIREVYETNCMDPLTVLSHDIPNYEVKFHTEGESFGQIELSYPGTITTKFRVRAFMESVTNPDGEIIAEDGSSSRYGNAVMNINEVELLIKKQGESEFSLFEGSEFTSELSHGATPATVLYPTYMALNNQRGNWTRQGIAPFAYASHPYDDFYFTDFITRIHKDDPMDGGEAMLSYCPMSTRYNDGRYHLKARVTNVREQATDSPVQNVVIDNYSSHRQAGRDNLTAYGIQAFYPQNILNGKYYVLKCLRYLTLSEFYFFFLQYTHDCRSARRWCSGCLNMRARVGIITRISFWRLYDTHQALWYYLLYCG